MIAANRGEEGVMGEAREVMDRVTETAFKKDLEALKGLYAPNAVAETPDQGTVNGPDAIVEYLGEFMTAFPDASYESVHEHESGANAIDEGYFVGTHTGPLSGPDGETIEGTGKSVRLRACDVATVEGGVVTSHRFYFDNMELIEQLGLASES
jgi:ketosteroid isomerase-like protein